MARAKVTDKDKGWKKIAEAMRGPSLEVGVGLIGPKASQQHRDSDLTVAEIGTLHEFGYSFTTPAGTEVEVPARSFLRATIDQNQAKYTRQITQAARAITSGKISTHLALDLIGQGAVGDVQQRIADGIPPPNAPSTIARKGSSKPLIASGQTRQEITHEVRPKKAGAA
jgi:phage gpG-like protein